MVCSAIHVKTQKPMEQMGDMTRQSLMETGLIAPPMSDRGAIDR